MQICSHQQFSVSNSAFLLTVILPQTSAVPAAPLLNRLTSFDPTASGPPSYIAEGGVCSEEDCRAPFR